MKFSKKVLDNGLRIIVVPMKDNPTVTVLVMVEAGSKYEMKAETGLSHFLEHMMFKGTSKRPTAKDISLELDQIGSQYNAFTSQEYTGYYAKAENRHFHKLLDVVSDLYINPTLPKAEIEKEKGVIVEEINMYEDMPQRHIYDIFMQALYGDQPAGWNIAGTRESVRSMKQEDFIQYRDKHYVAEATTVLVAGHVDEAKVFDDIEKAFSSVRKNPKKDKEKVREDQKESAILVKYKKTDQTHLILGVRAFNIYDPRFAVLKVIEGVLSGGMSSRLFQKLREGMGVCYYVRAFEDCYTDHGVFAVGAGVTTERAEEVVNVLLSEFKKLVTEKVGDAELKKVKDYMVGTMYLGLESSDSLAEFYAYQEVLRRPLQTPDEAAAKIKAVTANDIQKVANDIFKTECITMALIGPFENGDKFKPLLVL